MNISLKDRTTLVLIIVISVVIPALVTLLFFIPKIDVGSNLTFLPALNAVINSATTVVLISAFLAIKNRNIELHKKLMLTALGLSVLFLLSYVTYHSTSEPTKFGGEGAIKGVYYFVLLTHIVLAVVIVPLVLMSFTRAFAEKFDKHKKIARLTLPLWLYVTITGVLVYLMISPYYQ
jgi:putative membrane protein